MSYKCTQCDKNQGICQRQISPADCQDFMPLGSLPKYELSRYGDHFEIQETIGYQTKRVEIIKRKLGESDTEILARANGRLATYRVESLVN